METRGCVGLHTRQPTHTMGFQHYAPAALNYVPPLGGSLGPSGPHLTETASFLPSKNLYRKLGREAEAQKIGGFGH